MDCRKTRDRNVKQMEFQFLIREKCYSVSNTSVSWYWDIHPINCDTTVFTMLIAETGNVASSVLCCHMGNMTSTMINHHLSKTYLEKRTNKYSQIIN